MTILSLFSIMKITHNEDYYSPLELPFMFPKPTSTAPARKGSGRVTENIAPQMTDEI